MSRIKGYIAKRGKKIVSIKPYIRKTTRSSCINEVGIKEDGTRYITIRGREYSYPYLPDDKIGGLVKAKSIGRYYNKNIKGNFY